MDDAGQPSVVTAVPEAERYEGGRVDDMTQEPREEPVASTEDVEGHAPAALNTLKLAMRRARFDDAERAGVVADLRSARLARLELLRDALTPLVKQIPEDVDMFDIGLMPGVNPRLFIDMIGFVEMSRDTRLYCFLQDTRHGRVLMCETGDIETMVDAITNYVARRLLDRDKALASDAIFASDTPARQKNARRENASDKTTLPRAVPARITRDKADEGQPSADAPLGKPRAYGRRFIGAAFAFLIDLLGAITFFTLLGAAGWMIWSRMHGQFN